MLDTMELQARTNLHAWGISLTPTVVLVPASPCSRRHCGGSVLGSDCMLCARPFGRNSAADTEREMERETGLAALAKVVLGD